MKVEIDVSEKDLVKSLSAMAKREARKVLREELEHIITLELKNDKDIEDLIKHLVMKQIDQKALWWSHIDDEVFGTMTRRDMEYFASGAKMAHSFDMEEKLGEEAIVDKLINQASYRVMSWVKGSQNLQNKLALAIREAIANQEEVNDGEDSGR